MPYRVKNTANDRNKFHLHRVAPKFIEEPSLCGECLKLGASMVITDKQFEINKSMLAGWEAKGMVEVTKLEEAAKAFVEGSVTEADHVKVEKFHVEELSTEPVEAKTEELKASEEAPKKGRKKLV